MIHPLTLLKGAGLGAGIMYFFDPVSGKRRQALVRDQLVSCCSKTERQAGKLYRDASNRLEGAKHELSSMMQSSDQGLVERIQEGAGNVGRTLGMQGENWSPTAKTAAVLAGAGIVVSFMKKTDLAALALGAVGLTFVANEMADREAMRSRGQQLQDSNKSEQSSTESEGDDGPEASVYTEKQVVHNL